MPLVEPPPVTPVSDYNIYSEVPTQQVITEH